MAQPVQPDSQQPGPAQRPLERLFVRVVQRTGWDVEFVEGRMVTFPTRDAALEAALQIRPKWIEVGEVEPETPDAPRHHRWRTLRQTPEGEYVESGLRWGDHDRR